MKEGIQLKWRKDAELLEEAKKRLEARWYEDDVKFLFGLHIGRFSAFAQAQGLDFGLEGIHLIFRSPQQYPDALLYNDKKKEVLNVEFERRSSDFKAHKHDPTKCDLIVCMIHDWDGCSIPVYELTSLPKQKEK